jgi:hypothetical protein
VYSLEPLLKTGHPDLLSEHRFGYSDSGADVSSDKPKGIGPGQALKYCLPYRFWVQLFGFALGHKDSRGIDRFDKMSLIDKNRADQNWLACIDCFFYAHSNQVANLDIFPTPDISVCGSFR